MNLFFAILWKNCIVRFLRHKVLLLFLILLPICQFGLISYGRSKISSIGKNYVNDTTYSPLEDDINLLYTYPIGNTKLLYTPRTEFTDNLMQRVQIKLGIPGDDIDSFGTEGDLVKYYQKNKKNEVTMGVVFKDLNGQGIPKKLIYDLRTFEKSVDYETGKLFSKNSQYTNGIGSEKYKAKGLLALQLTIDNEFISLLQKNNKDYPSVSFQEFPYPRHLNDLGVNDMFLHVLPLVTLFSFIFLCPDLLKRIVEEKSTGIKELMKMMGLNTILQWFGWFISSLFMNLIAVSIIVFLMKARLWDAEYPPIEYCSWDVLFAFLALYCMAGISKCFLLSTFFHKPTMVIIFGVFFWILSYAIPVSLTNGETMLWWTKICLMLLPNMCLHFGYQAIAVFELREIGAKWNNINSVTEGSDNDIHLSHVFIMLIVDSLLYIILAYYLDNVNPGPYGIKKPWHFIFTEFVCTRSRATVSASSSEEPINKNEDVVLDCNNPVQDRCGIKLENLTKSYSMFRAVDRLNIDFYKGEITVLLGHNGAGKTTTLSMLTGMINKTSGNIYIVNKKTKDLRTAKSHIGICTQHNLVFQDLTVFEHLVFFGMIKGLSYTDAKQKSHLLLEELKLEEKANELPAKLSGGMQRKLCLSIALIGDPEILILDEPTSGMDPETRRFIWDKLVKNRNNNKNCTTLISTHFMEEAEVIGDRIAIMNHGRLRCYGTKMFLKEQYGTGYQLKITKEQDNVGTDEVDSRVISQPHPIVKFFKNDYHVLDVRTVQQDHNSITFQLPNDRKSCTELPKLLKSLEDMQKSYKISAINISNITLEDIFIKVATIDSNIKVPTTAINITDMPDNATSTSNSESDSVGSDASVKSKFYSLITKRYCVLNNTRITSIMQCLPCVILIVILILLMGGQHRDSSVVNLNYNLSTYGKSEVFFGGSGENFPKMQNIFNNVVTQSGSTPVKVNSVSDAIIQRGTANIAYYKHNLITAAEFNMTDNKVNVMFSNNAIHGAPISLNLVTNTLLKALIGNDYSITAANFPLPGTHNVGNSDQIAQIQLLLLFLLLFPMAILTFLCGFISFPNKDRVSNMKCLQMMTGLSETEYWGSMWFADYLICVGSFIVIIGVMAAFATLIPIGWLNASALGTLLLILCVYGLAALPCAYIMSHVGSLISAVNGFLISGLFSGFVLTIVVYVMEESGDEPYERLAAILTPVFALWPQFGLSYVSLKFMKKSLWNYSWEIKSEAAKRVFCHYEDNPCCSDDTIVECNVYKSYFTGENNAFGNIIIYMVISAILYFVILISITPLRDWLYNYRCKRTNKNTEEINQELSSVLTRENSTSSDDKQQLLKVQNYQKSYNKKAVVKNISFNVPKNSLFGLLGINGAGKSTMFKMLAGVEPSSKGKMSIGGEEYENPNEYKKMLGYCPQEDSLLGSLTGRQILTLFADLRGCSLGSDYIQNIIDSLGLTEVADKCCDYYSGGTKRKLSLGIALIGGRPVILLDEPTTGVDPASRRNIWTLIRAIKEKSNSSIVLTSHSMDECEQLCDNVMIMKDGTSVAEDTPPILKETLGKTYKVVLIQSAEKYKDFLEKLPDDDEIKTAAKDASNEGEFLNKFLTSEKGFRGHFKSGDQHDNTYNYHVDKKHIRLSRIFEVMELLKECSAIQEYTVNEPNLEDVFLQIAKENT